MLHYIIIWLAIFLPTFLILLFIGHESSGFKVTVYEFTTDKMLKKPLNIVMLSDLHDTDLGNDNEELLKSIDEIGPDFIVCAGDMITSYMQPKYNSEVTLSFLSRLSSKYDIYYGLGNHEQRFIWDPEKFPGKFDALMDFAGKHGIHMLIDAAARLDDYNCDIYGLNIPEECYQRVSSEKLPDDYVKGVLGSADKNKYNILLAHTPDQFDAYAAFEPDLVLSGHVHGGIIGIPKLGGLLSPQLKLFPKYDAGLFEKGSVKMIVSRGIGWHTLPIRINNKAEIINIKISHI